MSSNSDTCLRADAVCAPHDQRQALRHVAATVHVIAAKSAEGTFFATTATAVVSVCLEPPTLAICLNRSGAFAQNLGIGAIVSISALAQDQTDVAAACAGGVPHDQRERYFARFGESDHVYAEGAEASFSGKCVDIFDIGTHAMYIVNIMKVCARDDVKPLLYLDGNYGHFQVNA